MGTKTGSKGKAAGKKLAVRKETLRDLAVKGPGVAGGRAAVTMDRVCYSSNATCLCKTQLDCI